MNGRFIITFEDGTELKSHEKGWEKQDKDHAHALFPHNKKKWRRYRLEVTNGAKVEVDFYTGVFKLNDAVAIHPGHHKLEFPFTHNDEPQKFPVDESRKILNGTPYFPVYGRRIFMHQGNPWAGQETIYFVGWKKKVKGRTYQKLAFVMPDGEILMT
jgi:hypothetical protein